MRKNLASFLIALALFWGKIVFPFPFLFPTIPRNDNLLFPLLNFGNEFFNPFPDPFLNFGNVSSRFSSRTDKSYSRSPLKKGSIFRYVWCCRVRKCIKSPVSPSRNRGKSFQCWSTMIQAVSLWYIKAFKAVISRWSCHVSLSPYTSVGSKKWSKLSTSDKKCKSYQHHRNPMSIFCGWIFLTFLHIFIHLGQFPQEGENGQNVAFFYFGELCCD